MFQAPPAQRFARLSARWLAARLLPANFQGRVHRSLGAAEEPRPLDDPSTYSSLDTRASNATTRSASCFAGRPRPSPLWLDGQCRRARLGRSKPKRPLSATRLYVV